MLMLQEFGRVGPMNIMLFVFSVSWALGIIKNIFLFPYLVRFFQLFTIVLKYAVTEKAASLLVNTLTSITWVTTQWTSKLRLF